MVLLVFQALKVNFVVFNIGVWRRSQAGRCCPLVVMWWYYNKEVQAQQLTIKDKIKLIKFDKLHRNRDVFVYLLF